MQRRTTVFLLWLLVTALCSSVLSGQAVAAGAYEVTAEASKTRLVLGDQVVFTGTVSPDASGERVILQKRYKRDAKWVEERHTSIASDGTFRLADRPSTLKQRWYRVFKPAGDGHGAGESKVFKVQVYRWHYLTDLRSGSQNDIEEEEKVSINGTQYKKSLIARYDDETWIEYTVSRDCIKLVGTYGVGDQAPTGTEVNIELLGDGNQLYSQNFTYGQSDRFRHRIGSVLRLRYEITRIKTSVRGAVGSPRILCSF